MQLFTLFFFSYCSFKILSLGSSLLIVSIFETATKMIYVQFLTIFKKLSTFILMIVIFHDYLLL